LVEMHPGMGQDRWRNGQVSEQVRDHRAGNCLGTRKKRVPGSRQNSWVTVTPTTIGLRAEVTVHAEPINKDSSSPGAGL